jgi:hypothetical protein
MSDFYIRQTNLEMRLVSDKLIQESIHCIINRLICINILYFNAVQGEDYI